MSKQSLLLVDGDTRSLRVLEVSLRKAGFTVTPAVSVTDALDKLELHTPDLIISETKFPTDLDGFELRKRVRASADWAEIPFVFLTAETAIENKIRGLELGVDDYLTKPIYIKEIVTRINILLQKRQRANFDERKDGVRFAGRVADMPVVDVIQTIEVSRKSGVIQFVGERGRQAAIYFRDGRVIDAEAGTLQGEDAVYRLLTWSEGEFEVVFRTVRRREAITTSSQGLLMEGMRRLDEWSRLLEQLPPLTHRFEVDTVELASRLGEVPDDNNRILRLIDGKRSVLEVIDGSDFGDLECLQVISRLYFEGLLIDLDPDLRPRRDTGKPVPLVVVDNTPTPIEEVASGPIHVQDLVFRADGNAEPAPIAAEATSEVAEHEVLSEESVEHEDELVSDDGDDLAPLDEDLPGPLMGGYRPSSLRLIDEAVAAAQAIEPSLFDEPEEPETEAPVDPAPVARVKLATRQSDPRVAAARDLVERSSTPPDGRDGPLNGKSNGNGAAAHGDDGDGEFEPAQGSDGDATEPGRRVVVTFPRDDAGLRMIGSHGRDRAEASGELTPPPTRISPPSLETQRELVTIMPRRTTRELPVMVEPELEPEQSPEPPAAPPVEQPPHRPSQPPKRPSLPPPPRRISVEGGVRRTGPGAAAKTFFVLASVLSGATAYMYCHKRVTHRPIAAPPIYDAAEPVVATPEHAPPGDAAVAVMIDAPVVAMHVDAGPRPDALRVAAVIDAAVAQRADGEVVAMHSDAGVLPAAGDAGEGPVDRVKQASELLDRSRAALDDGDPETALALADKSIHLRPAIRGYLERARALQRLDRIDSALDSIEQALQLDTKYAASWELKGRILWAVRRYDEARTAFQKFLELDPESKSAPSIKHLLEEPR